MASFSIKCREKMHRWMVQKPNQVLAIIIALLFYVYVLHLPSPVNVMGFDAVASSTEHENELVTEHKVATSPKLHEKVFPSNWNTTLEALHVLRRVEGEFTERNFHEATHILFDIRSFLGPRRAKYLEIGSCTGVSASLMLEHPYPTSVTAVDPCVLPKTHYNGERTQEETIRARLSTHSPNTCSLTKPWDLRVGFSPAAVPTDQTFDIIFIDGDHSTEGVWNDYRATVDLLRPGGFLVFDDYLDAQDSPEVKGAVDDIAKATSLRDVGLLHDVHNIHPELRDQGIYGINEYIFQKPGDFNQIVLVELKDRSPLLCITVATYRREDRSTPKLLEILWTMLQRQSYTNWMLYITGDHYDDEAEWRSFSFVNDERVKMANLPAPGERGRIAESLLWYSAGLAGMNDAIDRLISDGHEWNVHLDDDDHWDDDHLQNIIAGVRTGATFVMTGAQHMDIFLPPQRDDAMQHISHELIPRPCQIPHSAVAYNVRVLKSRYQSPAGDDFAVDAYLWARIVYDDGFFPAYVPIDSAHHLSEGQGNTNVKYVGRKYLLDGHKIPEGWHGEQVNGLNEQMTDYTTIASKVFPLTPSRFCKYVVGPAEAPSGWESVGKQVIPYHIRIVKSLAGLQVWLRRK